MTRFGITKWFVFFAIVTASFLAPGSCPQSSNLREQTIIQTMILNAVRTAYVDTVSFNTLMDGAIEGIIDKLDPHSSYLHPQTAEEFNERIEGDFEGIGITFSIIEDKITVIEVIEDGPSEKAGIRSRDKIVSVDGMDVVGISDDSVKVMLRGPRDSEVTVGIERPGVDERLSIDIIRDRVEMNSVSHAYMLDEETGYLALTRFTLNTISDVRNALRKLSSLGMSNLVFDLRNNSGGSLRDAVGVVDFFLADGLIVETKGKREMDNHQWRASAEAPYADIPMVVLINHASASASEIVAGALQDHDRALIVGQTSFGKGLVMNQFPLIDRAEKKNLGTFVLSVAKYYTPSGRLIQREYNGDRDAYVREGYDDIDPNADEKGRAGKPVYYTDLGREVYGGGGITPDKSVAPMARLNAMETALRNTNLCFEFVDGYLLRHSVDTDFETFLTGYRIPDDELEAFREFIEAHDIPVDNDSSLATDVSDFVSSHDLPEGAESAIMDTLSGMGVEVDVPLFEQSRDFIQRELKQEIARMVWGSEERYRVWHTGDTELNSAISFIPEAESLLGRRLAMSGASTMQ